MSKNRPVGFEIRPIGLFLHCKKLKTLIKETISKSERTRMFIIEQAANLFNQKGYAGTSMDDILQATGLSKGGVYGNFKSKEEIAIAAFEHSVETVAQEIKLRTKLKKKVLDKLRAVVHFYQERILNPPVEGGCPILNTAVEVDDNNPVLRERVKAALDQWEQSIAYVIQRGIAQNEIRSDTDPRAFAVRFIATLEGSILLTRLYKDMRYFDTMSKQLFEMIEELQVY
ncbi:MAG: TetR/AcrR family transcriptional regulator [Saprospiraceae bacterium]|nr:TetR/AcrR family transcriptional regulator [Saprospiraceae bacterium]